MRILSRLPEGRGTGSLLGTSLARSRRRHLQPEILRGRQPDRTSEADEALDPIGPARGIGLAIGAGSIGWAVLLSSLL